MKVMAIGWAGVRTQQHPQMARFCVDVLGLDAQEEGDDFSAFALDDGSKFELFASSYEGKDHMATGPVVGFVVSDLAGAVAELRAAGVELLGEAGPTWQHFRAPDGNVYELLTTVDDAGS